MHNKQLPITCPICGKKNEFPFDILTEGAEIQCPSCKLKLKLHGHMLEEIQTEIARQKQKN